MHQSQNANSSPPAAPAEHGWRSHHLPTGRLEVRTRRAGPLGLDALCTFASRRNPRRGFLFVSRLLGRYMPVVPSRATNAHRALAAALPPDLPGPVAFVGIAEAGIALAHGVYEAWLDGQPTSAEHLFLHSTRHPIPGEPVALTFEEPHSHAPSHLLHRPRDRALADRLERARTVVVVDDEVTTGTTLGHFIASWRRRFPAARRFIHPVLTSWCSGPLPEHLHGARLDVVALTEAEFRWTPLRTAALPPKRVALPGRDPARPASDWGRLGLAGPRAPTPPPARPGERVLVVGTEEHQWPGLRLAAELEAAAVDARFVATTRAPVLTGAGIERAIPLSDAYDEGRETFLYNVDLAHYDRVVLVTDGPATALRRELAEEHHVQLVVP